MKVADILDQALAGLDKGFAGSKATEGALLDALGRSYHGLGLYPKAEEAHRKARAVREAALGPSHRDSLASAFRLAQTIWHCGRQAEAWRCSKRSWSDRSRRWGSTTPTRWTTRDDLYWHYAVERPGRRGDPAARGDAGGLRVEARPRPSHHPLDARQPGGGLPHGRPTRRGDRIARVEPEVQ